MHFYYLVDSVLADGLVVKSAEAAAALIATVDDVPPHVEVVDYDHLDGRGVDVDDAAFESVLLDVDIYSGGKRCIADIYYVAAVVDNVPAELGIAETYVGGFRTAAVAVVAPSVAVAGYTGGENSTDASLRTIAVNRLSRQSVAERS